MLPSDPVKSNAFIAAVVASAHRLEFCLPCRKYCLHMSARCLVVLEL